MEFNFKSWITLNKVWEERPWSINGYLVILYDYNRQMVYQDLDWEHQSFWIQLKKLLPEHMNPPAVKKIGEIMGEVIAIQPEDTIPSASYPVKVCVQINLSNPLRRGVMALTNSGCTRWIKFFYEKQTHKICTDCYLLQHVQGVCKAAAEFLDKAHKKPHFFEAAGTGGKRITQEGRTNSVIPKAVQKETSKKNSFVHPQDGLRVISRTAFEDQEGDNSGEGRLGKRPRSASVQLIQDTSSSCSSS